MHGLGLRVTVKDGGVMATPVRRLPRHNANSPTPVRGARTAYAMIFPMSLPAKPHTAADL